MGVKETPAGPNRWACSETSSHSEDEKSYCSMLSNRNGFDDDDRLKKILVKSKSAI